MTPLRRALLIDDGSITPALIAARFGLTPAAAEAAFRRILACEGWCNDLYLVRAQPVPIGTVTGLHLSVARRDGQAVHDWRDLQHIKTAVAGADAEAVELYPAEARVVDLANQYHLWALPRGRRWPFGFAEGMAADAAPLGGPAKQRPRSANDVRQP